MPFWSQAVQCTQVVPSEKRVPEGGEQISQGEESAKSVAAVVKNTVAPNVPVASATIFVGDWIVGAVVSTTVTVKVHVLEAPSPSLAWQVTAVIPRGSMLPEAWVLVSVTEPPQ